MDLREDGAVEARTGGQHITGKYTVAGTGPRLLFIQHDVTSNDEPNCQGIPASYVMTHYVYRSYIEVTADTLRLFSRRYDDTPALVAIRGK